MASGRISMSVADYSLRSAQTDGRLGRLGSRSRSRFKVSGYAMHGFDYSFPIPRWLMSAIALPGSVQDETMSNESGPAWCGTRGRQLDELVCRVTRFGKASVDQSTTASINCGCAT